MISEQHLQNLTAQTFSQQPYTNDASAPLNPLPTNASPEQVQATILNARNTVVSRNFVSTFRCLPREYMTGATPLTPCAQKFFTSISWKTIESRRTALRNETARDTQDSVHNISTTHPQVVQHMKDGAAMLNLHLSYLVQQLAGGAAISHNFSSAIIWLKSPAATALLFSSGRVVMTGCCSKEDCEFAANKYIKILSHYIPQLPWKLMDLKVQNVVCSANTGFLINLVKLSQNFPGAVNLDLRLFPGACFRLKNLPPLIQLYNGVCVQNTGHTTVINVFRTGTHQCCV